MYSKICFISRIKSCISCNTKYMKTLKKILRISLISLILLFITTVLALSIIMEPKVKITDWENLDETKLTSAERTITLLDDEENILFESMYDTNKTYTNIQDVPKITIDAFVSIEDKRFYKHKGIDYLRILSAVKANLLSRSFKEGASTISQQLVKNTHLSNEKSISRKVQEIRIARDLERNYSKDEIMEMYLNILYFGNNIYGIGSAAKTMFGKSISELNLSESALLAGIINNPTIYSPYKNPDKALKRRNLVLSQMLKNNKITQIEYKKAIDAPLQVYKISNSNYQYVNSVINEASRLLNCDERDLFRKNLKIGTNLDVNLQNCIADTARNYELQNDTLMQILIMNNLSGNITSVYGNGEINLSGVKRQPGSTIKPILSYAPALEKDLIVPITPILDQKMKFGSYSPSNFNSKYMGWTTVQNSLINSSNVCAVKLLEMTGIEKAKTYARKCGIKFSKKDTSLAIALGGLTDGLSLQQIANAYQVFANDGNYIESGCIRYIKDNDGKYLFKRKPHETRVFSSETAFFINSMLAECAKTGTARKLSNIPNVCAKTGTVGDKNGNTDAYCIAYNADYTIAVWIGSKTSEHKHNINGGGMPTAIANAILKKHIKTCDSSFNKPSTIIETEIDADELNSNHKIVAANEETPPKYRKKAYFTKSTAPQRRENTNTYYEYEKDDILIDFDNFEII